MLKSFGLTHVALTVGDVERSVRFYQQVLGLRWYFRENGRVYVRTPDCHDSLTLEHRVPDGTAGAVVRFGFRLRTAEDLAAAAEAVQNAGGRVVSRVALGAPELLASDPDGLELRLWCE